MTHTLSVEKATLYEKYRLPYTREAVPGLLKQIGKVKVIADIGTGTGQLARLFADRCEKIYAVEPDPGMREVARESLKKFSTIHIIEGTAEQTTLAENSIDLIVIGNAFHRFKPEACDELHRILKQAGWVAIITYTYQNQAFTDMLFSKLPTIKGWASRAEKSWHRTPEKDLFRECQVQTHTYRQSQTEEWEAFFGAACAGIESPEKTDPEFAQFEAINREVFDAFSANGKIQLDYETRVSFAQPLQHI